MIIAITNRLRHPRQMLVRKPRKKLLKQPRNSLRLRERVQIIATQHTHCPESSFVAQV